MTVDEEHQFISKCKILGYDEKLIRKYGSKELADERLLELERIKNYGSVEEYKKFRRTN